MIVTVIGARPQFVKAAVLSAALKRKGIPEFIIHTGQHYDEKMSAVFFSELGLPGADINLNIGSGSHGMQTAEMLLNIEKVLLEKRDEIKYLLVYGDTNSTLAGALAAAKLNIPVIHVEAGLRSFNKTMPEEINRIMTDHLSSLLFCSSIAGRDQLAVEGISSGVNVCGDIMLDAFLIYGAIAKTKIRIEEIIPNRIIDNYILLTIHRPSNTDDPSNLAEIFSALEAVNTAIVWPVHPRTRARLRGMSIPSNVHLFEPFSYFEMMQVLMNCRKVITDSGGLQKEAYWAKKPCITIRTETEWTETTANNWNIITGTDRNKIIEATKAGVDTSSWSQLYGNGETAELIAGIIEKNYHGVQE